jgi:Ca2+-binding EF-hand superfamily protein
MTPRSLAAEAEALAAEEAALAAEEADLLAEEEALAREEALLDAEQGALGVPMARPTSTSPDVDHWDLGVSSSPLAFPVPPASRPEPPSKVHFPAPPRHGEQQPVPHVQQSEAPSREAKAAAARAHSRLASARLKAATAAASALRPPDGQLFESPEAEEAFLVAELAALEAEELALEAEEAELEALEALEGGAEKAAPPAPPPLAQTSPTVPATTVRFAPDSRDSKDSRGDGGSSKESNGGRHHAALARKPPRRHAAQRSAASSASARRISCKKLFAAWDTDGSGVLEFGELRAVFDWLRRNAPPQSELDLEALWQALPESGGLDAPGFEAWMLRVTKTLDADAFQALSEKLHEYMDHKGLQARRLFERFDTDGSGSLDLDVLHTVLDRIHESEPSGELDVHAMRAALPSRDRLDAVAFEHWLTHVTRTLSADAFDLLTRQLASYSDGGRIGAPAPQNVRTSQAVGAPAPPPEALGIGSGDPPRGRPVSSSARWASADVSLPAPARLPPASPAVAAAAAAAAAQGALGSRPPPSLAARPPAVVASGDSGDVGTFVCSPPPAAAAPAARAAVLAPAAAPAAAPSRTASPAGKWMRVLGCSGAMPRTQGVQAAHAVAAWLVSACEIPDADAAQYAAALAAEGFDLVASLVDVSEWPAIIKSGHLARIKRSVMGAGNELGRSTDGRASRAPRSGVAGWLEAICEIPAADATGYSQTLAQNGFDVLSSLQDVTEWPSTIKPGHLARIRRNISREYAQRREDRQESAPAPGSPLLLASPGRSQTRTRSLSGPTPVIGTAVSPQKSWLRFVWRRSVTPVRV